MNAEERFTHYSQKDFAPLPAPFNPNGEAFRGEYIFHVYQPNILDNRRSNESLSSVPSSLLSAFRLTTEGLRSLSIFSRNGLGYINPSSSNNNNNNNNSVIPLPTPENRDLASLTAVRRLSNSLPEPRPFLVSHFFKAFNAVSSTDQVGAALHT